MEDTLRVAVAQPTMTGAPWCLVWTETSKVGSGEATERETGLRVWLFQGECDGRSVVVDSGDGPVATWSLVRQCSVALPPEHREYHFDASGWVIHDHVYRHALRIEGAGTPHRWLLLPLWRPEDVADEGAIAQSESLGLVIEPTHFRFVHPIAQDTTRVPAAPHLWLVSTPHQEQVTLELHVYQSEWHRTRQRLFQRLGLSATDSRTANHHHRLQDVAGKLERRLWQGIDSIVHSESMRYEKRHMLHHAARLLREMSAVSDRMGDGNSMRTDEALYRDIQLTQQALTGENVWRVCAQVNCRSTSDEDNSSQPPALPWDTLLVASPNCIVRGTSTMHWEAHEEGRRAIYVFEAPWRECMGHSVSVALASLTGEPPGRVYPLGLLPVPLPGEEMREEHASPSNASQRGAPLCEILVASPHGDRHRAGNLHEWQQRTWPTLLPQLPPQLVYRVEAETTTAVVRIGSGCGDALYREQREHAQLAVIRIQRSLPTGAHVLAVGPVHELMRHVRQLERLLVSKWRRDVATGANDSRYPRRAGDVAAAEQQQAQQIDRCMACLGALQWQADTAQV
ncbi:hypothetical protein CDCA_CDCA03G1126 [Cyanidium caldarium]|uniref:Uncharacterized protein n=1 Tax=Cyanidium caldarium TaxID=2771 RepID=A0AAV9ISE2_CYACA|nr:hypothetical protein CDCA_CDCA03G1126 [Cyanidium caldarium]